MNSIIEKIKYKGITFNLPSCTGRLLAHYGWESRIVETNKFVVDTLESFIKENCRNIKPKDIREVYPCIHISFNVLIPRLLYWKMLWVSFKAKVSLHGILNEALGYSLPYLMDIEQFQEDSMLEQVVEVNRDDYKE